MGKKKASQQDFMKWLAGQDTTESKNKLRKAFREQTGLAIGNAKANELIGMALNKPKDLKKVTRKSTTPKPKKEKTYFPMPHKEMYKNKKYAWVVGYRFQNRDGVVEKDQYGFSSYVTVISDQGRSETWIKQQAYDYIEQGRVDNADNRYDDIKKWYPSTLTIVERYYNPWEMER